MIDLLGVVEGEARAAIVHGLTDLGLPAPGPDLISALGKLNEGQVRDVADAVAEAFMESGLFLRYPDLWVRWRLGEWPWSAQARIMRAVAEHRKVAVHSSFGIGKDWTAARIIAGWIDCHGPGDAFVVSTAPTFAQVRAILWREVRAAFAKAQGMGRPLPGRVNMTEWLIGSDLVGFGRKPAAHDQASFQGLHQEYMLVVLDEAGGIPEGLFEDAEKLVTTEGSRILAIGNPTHEGSHWWKVCTGRVPGWHVIHVSAFDTPAFTGEPVPEEVLRRVTSRTWVDEQAARFTPGSPRYQQQVLGVFSRDSAMTTIPLAWARRAMRDPDEVTPSPLLPGLAPSGPVTLGVDVGAGGDWFTIRAVHGRRVGRLWRTMSNEPGPQADLVVEAARAVGASRVVIDGAGIGYAMPDLIRQRAPGLTVDVFDAGSRSDVVALPGGRTCYRWEVSPELAGQETEVFANLRAEAWWAGREMSILATDTSYRSQVPWAREAWDLSVLEDRALIDLWLGDGEDDPTLDELTTPGYEHKPRATGDVILIEGKDELRKASRLGSSTDHADAVLMACWPNPQRPPPPPAAPEFGGLEAFRRVPVEPRPMAMGQGRPSR